MRSRYFLLTAVLFIFVLGTAIELFGIRPEILAVAIFIVAPILFFGLLLFLDVFTFHTNTQDKRREEHDKD
jgi:hypothetical protein